ncbi:unnamed protein product, partial [Effrenium voratum]
PANPARITNWRPASAPPAWSSALCPISGPSLGRGFAGSESEPWKLTLLVPR